ncbi:sensor histidine kinase [Fulvivirga lutimaris]|nr:sensor histidine kinase [Fulvivirga lutimaris]
MGKIFLFISYLRFWIALLLFMVLCIISQAQTIAPESLKSKLAQFEEKDTTYTLLLCEYAKTFENTSYDSVLFHAKKANKLARNQDYERGVGFSQWLIGMSYYYLDRIDSAQINLERALPFAEQSGDKKILANIYNGMANVERYRGKRSSALTFYFQSLRIKETANDLRGMAITLNNIANVYAELGDRKGAWPYFHRSLTIRRSINQEYSALMLLSDIAENHLRLNNTDSAFYYLQRALKFAKESPDPWSEIPVYHGLFEYYIAVNNVDSAMNFATRGLKVAKDAGSIDREAMFMLDQCRVLNRTNDFTAALNILESALALAKEVKRMDYLRDGEKIRSEALAGLGRFQDAYKSHLNYKILSDSMQLKSYSETLRENELKYELEKQKLIAENERIAFDESRKWSNALLWLIVLVAFFISIVAFMLYRIVRIRTKANRKLTTKRNIIEEQNNEILAQNEELRSQQDQITLINQNLEEKVLNRTKELHETINRLTEQNEGLEQFSYIISHNLRAPLARITGLLNLMKMPDVSPAQYSEYFQRLEAAAKQFEEVISDLSEIISLQKRFDLKREKIEIKSLIESVIDLLETDLKAIDARLNFELGATHILTVRPFLHSIFLNLISNAIKYRSPKRGLEITIGAHQEDGICHFTVKDNGIGIPLDEHTSKKIFGLYNRFHPTIEGKGFGLYLVKTQLDLMGGRISVESEVSVGTMFSFIVPNEQEKTN